MTSSRPLRAALVVVLALAALAGLVAILAGRDSSNVRSDQGPGQLFADQGRAHLAPGRSRAPFRYDSDPPTSGPHVAAAPSTEMLGAGADQLLESLELGDVVIRYGDGSFRGPLLTLASQTAGRFSRALAAAGQAVLLDPQRGWAGVTAASWRHLLHVSDPRDPRLRAFVEYWLGRGAAG